MSRRSKRKASLQTAAPQVSVNGMQTGDATPPTGHGNSVPGFGLRRSSFVISIALAAMVWAVYGQTLRHEFVYYDDGVYVYENQVVQKGLTLPGVKWAFSYAEIGHWHPLTWVSHMLDCQFYGLWAGGHHLTNVLLHGASAILLFLALSRMTGALWRSAFVAGVFAVHPLHVESVAWVAERKDVLSGLFFMLTIGAYARYARGPRQVARYVPVVLLFALGLMCKNMLVALPFVLLLLDYWPLGRWSNRAGGGSNDARSGSNNARSGTLWPLLIEKVPLFALSAASCIITSLVPEKVASYDQLPFLLRLENAVISCVIYLRQMVWPSGLIVPYPNPTGDFPWYEVFAALVFLAAISMAVCLLGKKRPWLVVGWLWYLGMLAPVVGIVQISTYAHADRYTYLPQIGLYIAGTWLAAEGCARLRHGRLLARCAAAVILAVLMFTAHAQTHWWKDDETLWAHTLAVMPDNAAAHNNLGCDFQDDERLDEAIAHFQKALEIKPDYATAHYNLGRALRQKGDSGEAIVQYEKALEIDPDYAAAHNNLGNLLIQAGRFDEALFHFRKAVEIKPDFADAQNNLGGLLLKMGQLDEAIFHFHKALEINPDYAEAHNNLGNALQQTGRLDEANAAYQKAVEFNPSYADAWYNLGNALRQSGRQEEAIAAYQEALKARPEYTEVQINLANLLATCGNAQLRNGAKAVELAQRANQATGGNNPVVLGTLAAAYAETGHFPEAVETAQQALKFAAAQSNSKLVQALRSQIVLYQANKPLRDNAQ